LSDSSIVRQDSTREEEKHHFSTELNTTQEMSETVIINGTTVTGNVEAIVEEDMDDKDSQSSDSTEVEGEDKQQIGKVNANRVKKSRRTAQKNPLKVDAEWLKAIGFDLCNAGVRTRHIPPLAVAANQLLHLHSSYLHKNESAHLRTLVDPARGLYVQPIEYASFYVLTTQGSQKVLGAVPLQQLDQLHVKLNSLTQEIVLQDVNSTTGTDTAVIGSK
jgi:hypothetical protein